MMKWLPSNRSSNRNAVCCLFTVAACLTTFHAAAQSAETRPAGDKHPGLSAVVLKLISTSERATARLEGPPDIPSIVLKGHEGTIWRVAFSPDSKRLVSASSDKTARIWDVATGEEQAVLRGHKNKVNTAAFSPDGQRVVTASGVPWKEQETDNTARIWDVESGKEQAVLRGHTAWIESATFSPDGQRILTVSRDSTARIWSAEDGKELVVLGGEDVAVESAMFSSDGARVVTASTDTARVWDVESGKELLVLGGEKKSVRKAVFSPDDTLIVTTSWDKRTVSLWDAATGKQTAALVGHKGGVQKAVFNPDSTRLITMDLNWARVWNVPQARKAKGGMVLGRTLEGSRNIQSISFRSDGTRFVMLAGMGYTVTVGDVATGKKLAELRHVTYWIHDAVFSPDGTRVATAVGDKTIRIWDAESVRAREPSSQPASREAEPE